MSKIILFEVNEVPTRIFEYYIGIRKNSWIAENFSKFKKYNTVTENEGHLSPWNTWPTLHRGVPSSKHFIADFGQDLEEMDNEFPPIWKILQANEIKTGIFASLHSSSLPKNMNEYDFFVPDVFAPNHECFPNYVESFQKINLKLIRESGRNVSRAIPYKDTLNLVSKIGDLGIKTSTILDTGKQLVEEKIDPWKVVRRRTFQAVLSFDVFYKLLVDKKPDFTTFFTNHVASSMHRYWAALFPEEYTDLEYDMKWIETYSNEILFSMDKLDAMLRKLGRFVDYNRDYKLLITSSMGQEAVECEPTETQLYTKDNIKFIEMLIGEKGVSNYEIMPSMVPSFNFRVKNGFEKTVKDNLSNFSINGEKVHFKIVNSTFFSVDLGHLNLKSILIHLNEVEYSLEELGLINLEIQDKSSSTAYHIPEGHLFSYHPTNKETEYHTEQLPTCDILPILLNNFNINTKPYMNKTAFSNL